MQAPSTQRTKKNGKAEVPQRGVFRRIFEHCHWLTFVRRLQGSSLGRRAQGAIAIASGAPGFRTMRAVLAAAGVVFSCQGEEKQGVAIGTA